MPYLEYELSTKQVVQIHEDVPNIERGYDYAISDEFEVGDEFKHTIWINEVDEHKNVTAMSSIRNNPHARRLLEDNLKLSQENALLGLQVVELKMESMDKSQIIDMLGEEVAKIKLELLLNQMGS